MSVTKQQAAALYAAVFNRAPDQAGLNYWIEQESFNIMAESFVAHPVFTEQYGDLDNQAFVEAIYENVLLGQGDAEGIEFWVGALDAGLSRGEFLASFIDASLNYDGDDAEALLRKDALVNKVTVGLYYTDTFGEATNFPADADIGSADIVNSPVYQKAAAAIENVTADPETVEAAKAEIDREVEGNELVNALETYQAALVAQTEADKAADNALKAAVKGLGLTDDADADAVARKVDELADEALNKSELTGSESLELNDATIQLARDKFENSINLAQAEVDVLKAQNKAAVNLQEKIEAYSTVAKEINATVTAFDAEAAKFAKLNGVETAPEATFDAEQKLEPVTFGEFELTVKNGKVVATKQKTEGEGEEATTVKEDATAEFNKLDGADAFAAQLVALNANTAKQANAQKAIEAATLQALKDAGYKVFDADNNQVAWSKVKFDAEGKLVAASDEDDTVYQVKTAKDADEEGTVDLSKPFFTVPAIEESGTVSDVEASIGEAMPSVIADAAANSEKAVEALETAKNVSKAFEAALKEYNDAVALQTALTEAEAAAKAAGEAVDAAEEAFAGLGYHLVVAEEGVATGELITNADEDPNLFVYNTDLKEVNNFSGDDLFFFGDKAAALVVVADDAKKLGGDNSVLEIFAKQDGNDTILYVEKAAFAGGSSTGIEENGSGELLNKDLVKITLTGVQADELVFENGFLQF